MKKNKLLLVCYVAVALIVSCFTGTIERFGTRVEGGDLPVSASFRSSIKVPANQLRDPAIFQEDGRTFLLYVVAGESGIAIAELFLDLRKRGRPQI